MSKKLLPLNYTFLLDASGSMIIDAAEVRQEMNEQIKELKMRHEELKRPCRVSLHVFNRQLTTLRKDIPIQNIQEIEKDEYQPRGCTALLDAMGHTLSDLEERLGKKVEKRKAEVVLVVFTDGRENASKNNRKDQVYAMLNKLQAKQGWSISLVGTDWQGIDEGRRMGLRNEHAHFYVLKQKLQAMRDIRSSVSSYYLNETCSFRIKRKNNIETGTKNSL